MAKGPIVASLAVVLLVVLVVGLLFYQPQLPDVDAQTFQPLTTDLFQSAAGSSISLTGSYVDILPQQTWTPLDMTNYAHFYIYSVLTIPNIVLPSVVQTTTCSVAPGPSKACAFSSNTANGNILAVGLGVGYNGNPSSISISDTQSLSFTLRANKTNSITQSDIWTATTTGGAETITISNNGQNAYLDIAIYEVHGSTLTGLQIATGSGRGQSLITNSSITFSGSPFLMGMCSTGSNSIQSGGVGYTFVAISICGTEYATSGVASPTNFPFTRTAGTVTWTVVGIMVPPAFVQPTINFKLQYSADSGSTWVDISSTPLALSSALATPTFELSSQLTIALGAKASVLVRGVIQANPASPISSITLYKLGIEVVA